ncbi:hypothetical protein J3R03_005181 [Actinoplanes couchii]|nr:hypothetical protein [Actinoplanes couchii]
MGAIKPWQLVLCSMVCLLGVTGVVAAVVLAVRGRTKKGS